MRINRRRLACLLLLLAACTPREQPAEATLAARNSTANARNTLAASPDPALPLLPTQAGDPLRFTFPTPGPQPIPAWRPPPYEVPWSLRPEDHFWFARPIAADEVNWPLAVYRYGGTYFGQMSAHAGVDINAPIGTPVLAAGPGKVVWVGWGLYGTRPVEDDPYGLAIAIEHDFGFNGQRLYTVYAHLSAADVWLDQPVVTGQQIGAVGLTGNTTGQHLHFEVRQGDNNYWSTRNPELWLAPPQGWGVLAGRVLDEGGRPIPEKMVTIRSQKSGQRWQVWTYGKRVAQPDDFYQENFVISDLPAGPYRLSVSYWIGGRQETFTRNVDLLPGRTTLAVFTPEQGFVIEPTPTPRPFPTAPLSAP